MHSKSSARKVIHMSTMHALGGLVFMGSMFKPWVEATLTPPNLKTYQHWKYNIKFANRNCKSRRAIQKVMDLITNERRVWMTSCGSGTESHSYLSWFLAINHQLMDKILEL